MKNIIIAIFLVAPALVLSQNIADKELVELCIVALQDFETSPLKIHSKDDKILVTKPRCGIKAFPKKVGNSKIEWICFDEDLAIQLKSPIAEHNGRSIIIIYCNQLSVDSVTVRIDQWTVSDLEKGMSLTPINEIDHPKYKDKNHDYLFTRTNAEWVLIEKLNDANPPTPESEYIEELFQKGNSLSREGKYEEALEYVNKSMEMDSSLYQRYLFRAGLKVELGRYESAIKDVTKCIDRCDCEYRNSHVASYYLERSNIYILNNEKSKALEDIEESISLNPENWRAYFLRASHEISLGEYKLALDDLNKSIKLDDKVSYVFHYRGVVYTKLEDFDAACADFSSAIKLGLKESQEWKNQFCK